MILFFIMFMSFLKCSDVFTKDDFLAAINDISCLIQSNSKIKNSYNSYDEKTKKHIKETLFNQLFEISLFCFVSKITNINQKIFQIDYELLGKRDIKTNFDLFPEDIKSFFAKELKRKIIFDTLIILNFI
jgi:hypothetical protein